MKKYKKNLDEVWSSYGSPTYKVFYQHGGGSEHIVAKDLSYANALEFVTKNIKKYPGNLLIDLYQ